MTKEEVYNKWKMLSERFNVPLPKRNSSYEEKRKFADTINIKLRHEAFKEYPSEIQLSELREEYIG